MDVLEKFALHGADGVCFRLLDKHRVLVNQPRISNDIGRRILHLQYVSVDD